jgi:hypothetical protein
LGLGRVLFLLLIESSESKTGKHYRISLTTSALIALILGILLLLAIVCAVFFFVFRSPEYEYFESSIEMPIEPSTGSTAEQEPDFHGIEFENQLDSVGTGDLESQFELSYEGEFRDSLEETKP